MAFGERKAEVFIGLESKFGRQICQRVQKYFIIHKSETWEKDICVCYIKNQSASKVLEINFPK